MNLVALAIIIAGLAVAIAVVWHGRDVDIVHHRKDTPAATKQAAALARIANLLDRETFTGYRDPLKARERGGA